jgi:hypothetical protein
MKWITRERPKIDRIACPWLIRRFIDREAEFLYVPKSEVLAQAEAQGAIPYDIPGVEYSHDNEACTFDYFVKKHGLAADPVLEQIAVIVRGADTDRFDLAPQAAGLWAISAGLSHNYDDDLEQLAAGMVIYDALYSWAKYAQQERHSWDPNLKL